jgi:ATP-dependent DNA helicase RecG
MSLELTSKVQYVKGVGPRKADALAAAGITTVSDLLMHLPFRYDDWTSKRAVRDLRPGEQATLSVEVAGVKLRRIRRRFTILEVLVGDETGQMKALWFNQEFLKDTFRVGRRVHLLGKVVNSRYGGGLELRNPQFELSEQEETSADLPGRLAPVYERIGPISSKMLRRIFRSLIEAMPPDVPEILPASLCSRHHLPSRRDALIAVHQPEEDASLDLHNQFRAPAQMRLIFEELFVFFLAQRLRRQAAAGVIKPRRFSVNDRTRETTRKILPFRLTEAQKRVLKTIADDLASRHPMQRLVQGDVGSGKTIVAVLAAVIVMEKRSQVAFMVPTELLAEQHHSNIHRLLTAAGYRVALLTSSLKRTEREELLGLIAEGGVDLVVGTHALIQEQVRFKELGLAIIDEQHRFGVLQRSELLEKGFRCDLLIMTATPIPRSLALTLFGDLDTSVLDELPPGRHPIRTRLLNIAELDEVCGLMEAEIVRGHQVYFVCPLIEESEKMDLNAAVVRHEMLLHGAFSHRRVALVHGRMSRPERESVMAAFAQGKADVLVATTVVEVGVDVPNATLMVIEHAERFGLSQLHQLRGRVGRGPAPSTATLLYKPPLTAEAERRLQAMVETDDGFRIAERDLEIRGPGDYFGTRQSGLPMFRVADMLRDAEYCKVARSEADHFLASDESKSAQGKRLLRDVFQAWGPSLGPASGG